MRRFFSREIPYRKFCPASKAQLEAFTKKERAEKLALFRERMWDISWMMRTLREQLSRMANKEDGCGGRFWEGPSSSQPLLDDHGLLAAMVYVDLNPVRNRLARHPADSEGTSIERRIERHSPRRAKTARVPAGLLPMAGQAPEGAFALPFSFSEYVDVLEWTTEGLLTKRGRSQPAPSLISRLGIQPDAWLKEMAETPLKGFSALGRPEAMDVYARYLGLQKTRGIRWSRALFGAD